MECRRLNAVLIRKYYEAVLSQAFYNAEVKVKGYGVSYCVRYRPIGFTEWILQRGWWNDRGIWTEDGIFNDGIV